jgi:HEAT repeat protein
VRFCLVGALGHAARDGQGLPDAQRSRLLARLENLLARDADPGVRSRAATVLGECGPPAALPVLWKRVQAAEDGRVQEKAWAAVVEILTRSGDPDLVVEWDRLMAEAKQPARRVQLLSEVAARWQKKEETRPQVGPVQEALVQAHLEQRKWSAAFPVVRELLARSGNDGDTDKRLRWLLAIGEQAVQDENRKEALRVVQEAQAFLTRRKALAGEFERLEKLARQGP